MTPVNPYTARPTTPITQPIVAVSRADLPARALDLVPESVDLRVWSGALAPTPDELVALTRDAHGLICMHTERIDDAMLTRCPQLVVVSSLGVGHDHLDLGALARAGVVAGYTPGVLGEPTADLAFALILAVARQVLPGDRFVREMSGDYPDLDLLVGQDLFGATLGIVGYGEIGRAVARRARGFDMRVIHHSRRRIDDALASWSTLEDLAEQSDIVSIHAPLTAATRHLIDAAFLARMKSTAILVNTARGGVVDQAALVAALQQRRIYGAGLDVQVLEPVPPGDPLLSLSNLVLTPHIGSASSGGRRASAELAVANLLAGLDGEPLPAPLAAPEGSIA
jgi:glyoxylate reductase